MKCHNNCQYLELTISSNKEFPLEEYSEPTVKTQPLYTIEKYWLIFWLNSTKKLNQLTACHNHMDSIFILSDENVLAIVLNLFSLFINFETELCCSMVSIERSTQVIRPDHWTDHSFCYFRRFNFIAFVTLFFIYFLYIFLFILFVLSFASNNTKLQ